MPDAQTVRISHRARLYVEGHVFNLGEVSGENPQALCDDLADRLEHLAKILRGPDATPDGACEGCGVPLVRRRSEPGRFTIESRDDNGDPVIYGVHYPGLCVIDRHRRATERGEV